MFTAVAIVLVASLGQSIVQFPLHRAEAAQVATKLKSRFDAKITSDKQSNTLYMQGTAEQLRQAERIIQRLDKPLMRGVQVVRLTTADPAKTAAIVTLVMAFVCEDNFHAIPDERIKAVIFSGATAKDTETAEAIIRLFDGK